MSISLEILFEDNHCLIVLKPAPLLTQAPPGIPSLENQVKEYLRTKYNKQGRVYLGVPHRLDRSVTGAIVFARQSKSARRLSEQFEQRTVKKIYWALVEGQVTPEEGIWEDWLRKVPEQARVEMVSAEEPESQQALLSYRCLKQGSTHSFLEIELQTGRMHQIRAQAATRGHPVLGDVLYGASTSFGPEAVQVREQVIALHARSLTILHPIRYEPLTVHAPLPDFWEMNEPSEWHV